MKKDLPIKQILPKLDAALDPDAPQYPRAVLVAPPGAGKSSYVPLHLLHAAWAKGQKIILLEPRRLAARALAMRMADLLREEVGQTVGYLMRMDSNYSAKTRILVMTEGSFTRLILDDPELKGVAAVIFDEFHERSLEADFGLALVLDVAESLRQDLRILVMSATIDGERIASLLATKEKTVPVIEADGRNYPVDIYYRPPQLQQFGKAHSLHRRFALHAAKTCLNMLNQGGSILVFLPGQAEIRQTEKIILEGLADKGEDKVLVAPLYSGLDKEEQQKALTPTKRGWQKIVLATSIAESALTIEDIRVVVDSGLARLPFYDPVGGTTSLKTVRASKASIKQRAGRAGRIQEGTAIRLWREEQNGALPDFTPPEILSADLTNLILDCADFGISIDKLQLLDRPPQAAFDAAIANLQQLGALDNAHRITALGRALRQLPLPVKLANMLLNSAGKSQEEALQAAKLAIILTEQGLGGKSTDLDVRLAHFQKDKRGRAVKAAQLAQKLARQAVKLALEAKRVVHNTTGQHADVHPQKKAQANNAKQEAIAGRLMAESFSGYIARMRADISDDKQAHYLLANGRGVLLHKTSPLFGKPWLVCANLSGSITNATIRAAAEIEEAWLIDSLANIIEEKTEVFYDSETASLKAIKQKKLGAILLQQQSLASPAGEIANQGWLAAIRSNGLEILPWSKEARHIRARLAFLHQHLGEPWPDVSDESLGASLEDWLLPFLPAKAAFDKADEAILQKALSALPGFELERQLSQLAPKSYKVPTGSELIIRYHDGKAILPVKVQELFGLSQHPYIGQGKIPLLLELLSPAGRVLQITEDIAGFWAGSWQDVARDMRGRYPKHYWPDNPHEAMPTKQAKPRKKS